MVKNLGLKSVKDFAKYVLYTGFVENIPYPVSGLIIAPPERGKSSEVEKFDMFGVIRVDKTTAFGIADMIQDMTKEELKRAHHFIILDLENMASMSRDVRQQFLSFVKGITQEGMQRYRTGSIKLELDEPKKFGFLMCTTPEDLGDKRGVFRTLSFLSRPLPFTYNYSDSLRAQILDFVQKEDHNISQKYETKREEKEVVKLPEHYARALNPYALLLAKRTEKEAKVDKAESDLVGIRAKENMMSFLKAMALYKGRNVVMKKDFEEFIHLYAYMNFDYRKLGDN